MQRGGTIPMGMKSHANRERAAVRQRATPTPSSMSATVPLRTATKAARPSLPFLARRPYRGRDSTASDSAKIAKELELAGADHDDKAFSRRVTALDLEHGLSPFRT